VLHVTVHIANHPEGFGEQLAKFRLPVASLLTKHDVNPIAHTEIKKLTHQV
jgi:hypothetical protein